MPYHSGKNGPAMSSDGEYVRNTEVALESRGDKCLLAWCVHAYTALGLVAAAVIAVLIVRGDAAAFRAAFALMLVATLIDATDGFLARAVRVKEVLPSFDGTQLDYLTDFLTYVVLPLLLVWRATILPAGWEVWLLVPLLAGAYWFCQVQAKTDDGYFLGFPAYWNIVAFYLYVADRQVAPLPGWLSLGVLLVFSVLTFVPTRYLYSTNRGRLNLVTNVLAGAWVVLVVWIVYRLPRGEVPVPGGDAWPAVVFLSLLFPIYYLVVSWYLSWSLRRRGLSCRAEGGTNR
jgi:phosphatidylcholine synthase